MQELTDIGRLLEVAITQIKTNFTMPEIEELLFYVCILHVNE